PSHELAAADPLAGPHLGAGPGVAADQVAHDLRIGLHRRIGVEIGGMKRAQSEPRRLDRRDVERGHWPVSTHVWGGPDAGRISMRIKSVSLPPVQPFTES